MCVRISLASSVSFASRHFSTLWRNCCMPKRVSFRPVLFSLHPHGRLMLVWRFFIVSIQKISICKRAFLQPWVQRQVASPALSALGRNGRRTPSCCPEEHRGGPPFLEALGFECRRVRVRILRALQHSESKPSSLAEGTWREALCDLASEPRDALDGQGAGERDG